jgi:hypothetical protein
VQVVDRPTDVVATVALGDDGVRLFDAAGEPLQATGRPMSMGSLSIVSRDLEVLARAAHLRQLPSGSGPSELPDDVDISVARLGGGGGEVRPTTSGEHLFEGDRVVVHVRNRSRERRFVSVLDVGISGAISMLTTAEPGGTTLAAGECYDLGRNALGALQGLDLYWPDGVPATAPRPETFVAIVSDDKVDGLEQLTQGAVRARTAESRVPTSMLERLIEEVSIGRRDSRATAQPTKLLRYRVRRFDFLLHPERRGGDVDEPSFEIDERPDPSFRLVMSRRSDGPIRVAVRLKDLTCRAGMRIDTLVATAAAVPFVTTTGPADHDGVVLYEGPVARFLDLAVWVTEGGGPDDDLGGLLSTGARREDVDAAAAALAGLAVETPDPALVANAGAAVATIVRSATSVLRATAMYRTLLLPHQRFGVGRHPTHGLFYATNQSFAYEVVDLDRR